MRHDQPAHSQRAPLTPISIHQFFPPLERHHVTTHIHYGIQRENTSARPACTHASPKSPSSPSVHLPRTTTLVLAPIASLSLAISTHILSTKTNTMAFTRPNHQTLLSQESAIAAAQDGLCGDPSHTEKTPIRDCQTQKKIVLFDSNACYAIIHVQPASRGPVKLLRANL